MIERFLRLLETFKENQISTLLRNNRQFITRELKGQYFSNRARDYFANTQANGEPYVDFDDEPRRIVQIKQLINALYHAEMAFIDLENVNLRNGQQKTLDLSKLYFNTIHHAYQASYLLTHVDIDFMEVFGGEIERLQAVLHLVQKQADGYEKKANAFAIRIRDFPLSYNAGRYTGIAVDQMKPRQEGFDYSFLSRFSAELPGYIQQLRLHIHRYSEKISAEGPEINQQKLQELQENAIKIIFALDDLKENNFFIVFKLLKYINIVRNIITLSTSTFQQMVQFNETSQNVVRDNLAKLKYDLLPRLFALADRIEDQALLAPGTLSQPMMKQVKPLYDLLITYAKKPVSFETKGKELLTLEDAKFLNLRLEETHKRLSKTRTASVTAQCWLKAFNRFFDILELPEYKGQRISQLPPLVKSELARHYRKIRPIIEHHYVDLNNAIVNGLTKTQGWSTTLKTPLDWYYNYDNTDKISAILSKKWEISSLFTREIVTPAFHKRLNKDLLKHIIKNTDLALRPYQGDNLFIVDEPVVLGLKEETTLFKFDTSEQGRRLLKMPAPLTAQQAFSLAEYYDEKLIALDSAEKAYLDFMQVLEEQEVEHLAQIGENERKKLQQLYSCFQPYLMGIIKRPLASLVALDHLIIDSLTNNNPSRPLRIQQFILAQVNINAGFSTARCKWKTQRDNYLKEAQIAYEQEIESAPLAVNTQHGNRAHYLLKKDTYSKKIADYRRSLFKYTAALNLPARNRLVPQENNIPFPELENNHAQLAQPQQLLNIKRIFNALYYLEQIVVELEKLNEKITESKYVYHLLKAYNAINHIYQLSLSFYNDPHSRLLCRDLIMKAKELHQFTLTQAEPYLAHAEEVEPQEKVIEYNGLWYTLQAFMLIPEHVEALSHQKSIPADTLKKARVNTKKIAGNIEKIIHDSNSYFKLLLDTPVMYDLFMELKAKFIHFSKASHEAVMAHLEEISSVLFTRILTETDLFEAKLALKPGELATSMKAILDQFYQGLVEPMALVSAQHLELVFSSTPIKKRQIAVQQRATVAELKLKQISQEHEVFKKLHHSLKSYLRFTQPSVNYIPGPSPDPGFILLLKKNVTKDYLNALPFLNKAEKELHFLLPKEIVAYPGIDKIFNDAKLSIVPVMENIVGLTAEALTYHKSQPASDQRNITIAAYKQFADQFANYLQFSSRYLPSTPEMMAEMEKELILTYTKILPDLYQHQEDYKTGQIPCGRHLAVDQLLNGASVSIPLAIPAHLVDFVANLTAYYQGLQSSYQFERETAEEQQYYLKKVAEKDIELNEKYKTTYLQTTFAELVKKMAERRIGLLHIHSEYEKKLHTHLLSFDQEIIEQAKSSDDIRKKMILLLIEKTKQFQDQELRHYIHLDKVLSAIHAFYLYLDDEKGNGVDETSVYEVQDLIDSKGRLLASLKNIALDDNKSPSERLQELRTAYEKVEYSIPLTKQRSFAEYSLLWLQNCLINLLALLHLYTPTPNQRFNDLRHSAAEENKPPMPSFANQFGLFAKNERSYNEPKSLEAHTNDPQGVIAVSA